MKKVIGETHQYGMSYFSNLFGEKFDFLSLSPLSPSIPTKYERISILMIPYQLQHIKYDHWSVSNYHWDPPWLFFIVQHHLTPLDQLILKAIVVVEQEFLFIMLSLVL